MTVDIVVVDRPGEELQLVDVGPYGVVNAWLRVACWMVRPMEYLARSGTPGVSSR